MKDTQEELDRLEQELLADEQPEEERMGTEEALPEEVSMDPDEALLEEILSEYGALEADDSVGPEEALVYSNYTSDYGEDLQTFAETGETEPEKKNDKLIMGLMITASVLCAGITGILIYWLNAFLT